MLYITITNFAKHSFSNYLNNKNKGTSLEQLLVATLISSIIMLILFQASTVIKKQLLVIEQQILILYNQIIADFFLRTNIKNVGYKGYVSAIQLPQHSSINLDQKTQIVPKAPIAVCMATVNNCKDFVTAKILNKIIEQKIKPNTNILLAYDIPEQITMLQNPMANYDSPLQAISVGSSWNIGDQMIIADHRNIQRFIISDFNQNNIIHDKPYNTTSNFIKKFQTGAEIFRAKHIAFYIAKNDGYKSNTYSLYMDDFSSGINDYYTTSYRAEAILDHIEDLWVQILEEPQLQPKLAANLGWIINKYLLINLSFKNNAKTQIFTTGVEIRNSQP